MGYTHRSVDSLHGDEPEIDALAAQAEAGRDIDAEIDRRQERMDREMAKELSVIRDKQKAREQRLVDFRYRCSQMICDLTYLIKWSDTPNGINDWTADNVAKQAERLQQICREMAK